MAGVFIPLSFSKEEQWGRRCLFYHRFRSRNIFGVVKDFCPNFSKLPRKVFCATFSYKLSPQRSLRPFLVRPPKQVFMCFSANLGHRFLKSSNVGHHFHTDYQGCCQDFQQIKTFGCVLASPAPTSNTTDFHNSIIGNFMVYQDQLETWSLQLLEHSENSE